MIRQIDVGLVVGCGGEQDHLAVVAVDVFPDGAVALAFAVAEVVTLVDDHQPVAAQVGQLGAGHTLRQDVRAQPVLVRVVLPHAHQVLRAQDQGFQSVVVLEDAGHGGGHQRLAEPHHVADQHAAAFVQMVRGDLYCRGLKLEQPVAEVPRDPELGQAGARLVREVIRHLEIDVVGRDQIVARPALFDDVDQLARDVDAVAVVPALLEPLAQLGAGVLVEHVDVQLALAGQPGEGEVAAAEIPHHRGYRIVAEAEIQLGVERMPQKQLDRHRARPQLPDQPPQRRLVGVGRHSQEQLAAELLGELPLEPQRRAVVDAPLVERVERVPQLIVRQPLHADQDARLPAGLPPPLHAAVDVPPPAQIEVAHAEVGPLGQLQRAAQRRQQRGVGTQVIQNSRHDFPQ